MRIATNKIVTVHYSLKDDNDQTIENTYEKTNP